MNGNRIATALLSCIGTFALLSIGFADPPEDVLALTPEFKPTLNFSDTYGEKLLTTPSERFPGEPPEPPLREVLPKAQKIAAKVVANIEGFDFLSEIEDSTPVSLRVGQFQFDGTLGESDEAIKKGGFPKEAKKAKFTFLGTFDKPNGDTVERKVGSVTFSWTKTRLTVTLTVTDIVAAGLSEIAASGYIGLYQDESENGNKPSGSAKFSDEPIDVSVAFGSATGAQTALAKGTSRTSYKKFGSDAAGTLEEFALESVKLIGKADPNFQPATP